MSVAAPASSSSSSGSDVLLVSGQLSHDLLELESNPAEVSLLDGRRRALVRLRVDPSESTAALSTDLDVGGEQVEPVDVAPGGYFNLTVVRASAFRFSVSVDGVGAAGDFEIPYDGGGGVGRGSGEDAFLSAAAAEVRGAVRVDFVGFVKKGQLHLKLLFFLTNSNLSIKM